MTQPRHYKIASIDLATLAPNVLITRCVVCQRLVRADEVCSSDSEAVICPKFRLLSHIVAH